MNDEAPGDSPRVPTWSVRAARDDGFDADLGTVLRALGTTPQGLAQTEAARRLAADGPNEPLPPRRHETLRSLIALFANPLVLILLLAAVVSALARDAVGAALIVTMVLLGSALNFGLGLHSRRAVERLRAGMAPRASVLRDGAWQERPRRELVRGDVVRLAAGDQVPADLRLLEAHDLHLQQAALTGESVPVAKEAIEGAAPPGRAAEAAHRLFLGTSVVAGSATAVVLTTGAATAFGDIAGSLAARPPATEFERGLDGFAHLILRTVVFLVLFVVLIGVGAGRPPLQTLLFAVALAVGLTPEFMPMIVTVTLARGAVRMARRQVIVKHLAAIEDFGSMTVLLSDKTGTLTCADTTLARCMDLDGRDAPQAHRLAALNSRYQTGLRSPRDTAILHAPPTETQAWHKVDEIPFDFERRRLSVVVEAAGRRLLVTKGAPEALLGQCSRIVRGEGTAPLDDTTRAAAVERCRALGEEGLRSLAVAWREVAPAAAYGVADETDLIFAGLLGFADPLVPGVAQALRALHQDGLAVKILTGDDERVARHVCHAAGLDVARIVRGEEIDALDEGALGILAERTDVFARVSPSQKHRIVLALKRRGQVVGFLGDGINDAPSLHAADVGISVSGATDVAREAADIVLRQRDLRVLHAGVVEGRRAFANVMKYLLMGTSSNFGNMLSMALGVLFLPFLPMLPTQILLNNFLYDLAQTAIPGDRVDAALLRRPMRWHVGFIRAVMLRIGPISSVYDLLTFYVLLHWFGAGQALFHTGWFVESLATQTLVLFVIRTAGNPLRSRPSRGLAFAAVGVVLVGAILPYSPLAANLGFVPLPAGFFAFLLGATLTYLLLVQWAKRRVAAGVSSGNLWAP